MSEATNKKYLDAARSTETLEFGDIHERLSKTSTMRLLHSTLGLGSEIGELLSAVANDNPAEIIAELGDIFWFGGIGADAIATLDPEIEPWSVFASAGPIVEAEYLGLHGIFTLHWNKAKVLQMCVDVEQLQTNVKAHIYYGRRLDYYGALASIKEIIEGAKELGRYYGWSAFDIMKANIIKLTDKKHGRYKRGFTAGEANDDRDIDNENAGLENLIEHLNRDKE